MSAQRHAYELQAQGWVAGNKVVTQAKSLPARQMVERIEVEFETTISNTTGAGITPNGTQLFPFLQNFDHFSESAVVRSTGRMLANLARLMTGKLAMNPNDTVSIANGASGTLRAVIPVYFADPAARRPLDTALPTDVLEDRTFETQFAAGTTLAANQTITSGSLRVVCYITEAETDEDMTEPEVPAFTRIDFEDWAQATANLKPGAYTHAMVYDESDNIVTIGEYARLSLNFDGEPVLDKVRTQHLNADFNIQVGVGSGDYLAMQGGNQAFVPVLYQRDKYQISKLRVAEKAARADIDSGSLTTARWGYRQVQLRDRKDVTAALRKMKVAEPDRTRLDVKTASKMPLQGPAMRQRKLERLLPLRAVQAKA